MKVLKIIEFRSFSKYLFRGKKMSLKVMSESGRKTSCSTIGLRVSTKRRMDECRAPGQCYDGFIQQMVDHWEKSKTNNRY